MDVAMTVVQADEYRFITFDNCRCLVILTMIEKNDNDWQWKKIHVMELLTVISSEYTKELKANAQSVRIWD